MKHFPITPGNHGVFKKDGLQHVRLYSRRAALLLHLTSLLQWILWKLGIPWHNFFFNECTPDFNCCLHIYNWKTNALNKSTPQCVTHKIDMALSHDEGAYYVFKCVWCGLTTTRHHT